MTDDKPRPVSRRLRFEILRRDAYTCRYCGASAPDVTLTVDHVIPVALGGGDEPSNLVTACRDCNAGKGSTSPDERTVEDVDVAALLFARAMERAADIRRAEVAEIESICQSFYERHIWSMDGESDWGQGITWAASIERFIAAGLNLGDLDRLMHAAITARTVPSWRVWRYFCKCCWNEIGYRQELARRLIEDDGGAI